jgi:hypothetical protein
MSTVKSKNLQVGTDATASNNFTIYQPSTPDGTLRIGVGNADSPTEVAQVTSSGITMASGKTITGDITQTTAPAFIAKISGTTSVSNGVFTKINFDNELNDTNSNYASSRFTPTVAGYYVIQMSIGGLSWSASNTPLAIFKNGGWVQVGALINGYGTTSGIFYANGSTDYFEAYVYQNTGSTQNVVVSDATYFSGCLLQRA